MKKEGVWWWGERWVNWVSPVVYANSCEGWLHEVLWHLLIGPVALVRKWKMWRLLRG